MQSEVLVTEHLRLIYWLGNQIHQNTVCFTSVKVAFVSLLSLFIPPLLASEDRARSSITQLEQGNPGSAVTTRATGIGGRVQVTGVF